ncbi:hypothetical protein B0A50_00777 [Salinomyces thailandicus]|uniref:Glycoside hydrolase family 5 domain-containing protein n=1 Tax=Salinomyces thailandicus TaxID=706561 RepID=A0A4U0UCZ8_9PEZI|nr:hypothetical protein B0A50_00777 [Salinomyces thailandica]
MRFTSAAVATCAATATLAAPSSRMEKRASHPTGGIRWGEETIRGVNIGGWLVLEPWITPSIFQQYTYEQAVLDEYTLCETLGKQACHDDVLRPHWQSFYSQADFQKIADSGFNLVRIPIGYWAYDDSYGAYSSGAAYYLDLAIEWARHTGLKVLIDLHGAPGSQNGFDNSGQRTSYLIWQKNGNVDRTLTILKKIQDKYGDSGYDDVIAGIELLNEPLTPDDDIDLETTKQFERDGYGNQRTSSQSRVVVVQDGFQQPSSYNGWLTPSDHNAQWVALDHHEYQVFTNELVAMEPWQHRQYVCNNAYTYSGADKWTIVGEWSAAMTDCAAALNGYGIGARYDGTYPGSSYVGSCDGIDFIETWSQTMKDDTRGYIEAQMETFERQTDGWIFWTWKTEGAAEWDAERLIDNGVMPQPLTDRKFGQICT